MERAWYPETDCGRLVALSDGIFAVALTLGVVEILPAGIHQRFAVEGVLPVLKELKPQILWAAFTFFMVGIYWISHHRIFSYIHRTDEDFLTLNLIFLFCITLMPLSIAVVQSDEPAAVVLYAGFLGTFGLLQNTIWAYAVKHRLVDPGLSPEIIRYNKYRSLIPPLVFFGSIGLIRFGLNVARFSWLLAIFIRQVSAWLAKHPPELKRLLAGAVAAFFLGSAVRADAAALERKYQQGEVLHYYYFSEELDGAEPTGHVEEGRATATVVKEGTAAWHEDWEWTELTSGGAKVNIPKDFRQKLTLDPKSKGSLGLPPAKLMSGATTDTINFYVNLLMAIRNGTLSKVGDHAYLPKGITAAWSGAGRAVFGEDCFAFDMTLAKEDGRYATYRIGNVPPEKSCGNKVPAPWMLDPVFDAPNNWFQVEKEMDGTFVAEAGREFMDTTIEVDKDSGKILSAHMHNPVRTQARTCKDAAAKDCQGPSAPRQITREVVLLLVH